MNKLRGILYIGIAIFALTFLLSGCSPAPTPTVAPTITPTAPPTATATKAATPTPLPTATPTPPPSATATKPATPTIVPTTAPTKPPSATAAAAKTTGSSKDVCLGCHGPFDKLVTTSANYVWQNGDKTSPHRYVPHDSKNIPECGSCHKPHPVPPTASDIASMGKPNPQSCLACHHTGTLECGTCHEIPASCKGSTTSCGP